MGFETQIYDKIHCNKYTIDNEFYLELF